MRFAAPLRRSTLALLLLGAVAAAPALAGPKDPRKAEPPGIRWERSLTQARERSQREGRPLLVCVNALEDERANVQLATELYPSEAWGRSTRGYVCVVANPNAHAERDGACSRYGHTTCAAHQETLAWVLRTVGRGGALISPQHLILEPDGQVAYRKEYYTGEERPLLFETWLSTLAPLLARRVARVERESRLAALAKLTASELGAAAKAWLAEPEDGLAAAGLLCALDDAVEPARRRVLLEALVHVPFGQTPALVPAAEAATGDPDAEPVEALLFVQALLRVDRALGVWAAARVLARTSDIGLRTKVMEAWAGPRGRAGGAHLPEGERAAFEEALWLGGQRPATGLAPDDDRGTDVVPLLRRQRARARGTTGALPLPERLEDLAPGRLRAALLAAPPEGVAAREAAVVELLERAPWQRVRIASALALLGARKGPAERIERTLLDALVDPLEGPETHALALTRLGVEDPGENWELWAEEIRRALGAAK
jgi:hypothetical protein